MNKKNIPLIVQLKQNNNQIVQGINQNDAGVLFDMKVMDGLEVFDFSGFGIITLKFIKPDGTYRYDSATSENLDIIDPEKGRIKINIPTSCTEQKGMYNVTIGFGQDENTYFTTCSFNYYVGEVSEANDDDVTGQNEFPVLTNMILQMAGIQDKEELREYAESEREENEKNREEKMATLMALYVDVLGAIDDAAKLAYSMLEDVYEAMAQGASIDITNIEALATKTWVSTRLEDLDMEDIQGVFQIRRMAEDYTGNLNSGEFLYCTDDNKLYIGNANGRAILVNKPFFTAQAEEPTDTSVLWIDNSGTVPVIKYHDGNEWVSCNTAVFA